MKKEEIQMNQKGNVASALGSILLGALLIIMKGKIISVAITVLAVFVIIGAIVDFTAGLVNFGIVKMVAGVCILVFGWIFASLAFYILAAGIILMGLLQISSIKKTMPVNLTAGERFQEYFKPGLMVVAGACMLFNQSGTIAWAFIATGVLLIVNGIMTLVGANKTY